MVNLKITRGRSTLGLPVGLSQCKRCRDAAEGFGTGAGSRGQARGLLLYERKYASGPSKITLLQAIALLSDRKRGLENHCL